MISKTGAVLAFCGVAVSACATPTIVNPTWTELPAPDDMAEAYPGFAELVGFDGHAVLACIGLADGRLATCDVVHESPEGLGFGAAALEVSPRFRLSPRTVDGETSKSPVRFAVRFHMPDPEPASPYEGPEPDDGEVALAMRLAEMMWESAWGADEDFDLEVDEDRREVVERIIAEAEADFKSEEREVLALALARVLTPAQIGSMIEQRMPDEPLPPIEELHAAGAAEGLEISGRFALRVRQKYCAVYVCDFKQTPPPGSGSVQPALQPPT